MHETSTIHDLNKLPANPLSSVLTQGHRPLSIAFRMNPEESHFLFYSLFLVLLLELRRPKRCGSTTNTYTNHRRKSGSGKPWSSQNSTRTITTAAAGDWISCQSVDVCVCVCVCAGWGHLLHKQTPSWTSSILQLSWKKKTFWTQLGLGAQRPLL